MRQRYLPTFVSIVPGFGGPLVRPTPALAHGQDVVIDLHHELRTRTGTHAAKLHALAIAHAQLARTVHVRGCNRPVREGVAMVIATAVDVPVTTHLGNTGDGKQSGIVRVPAVGVRRVLTLAAQDQDPRERRHPIPGEGWQLVNLPPDTGADPLSGG